MSDHNEHSNARVLRDFYDAFGQADRERLAALVTPDFVWRIPGASPLGGEWRGVDGLLNGLRAIATRLGDGHNGVELLEVFGNERCAVSIHRDFYNGPDNHFDLRFFIYARMEGERIADLFEVPFDQAECDRYLGQQARLVLHRAVAQGADG